MAQDTPAVNIDPFSAARIAAAMVSNGEVSEQRGGQIVVKYGAAGTVAEGVAIVRFIQRCALQAPMKPRSRQVARLLTAERRLAELCKLIDSGAPHTELEALSRMFTDVAFDREH